MKGFNAADVDIRKNTRRDEHVVQAFLAAAIRIGLALKSVVACMDICESALGDQVGQAVMGVTESFVKIAPKDYVGPPFCQRLISVVRSLMNCFRGLGRG